MSRSYSYFGFNPFVSEKLKETKVVGKRKTIDIYVDGRPAEETTSDILEPCHRYEDIVFVDMFYGEEGYYIQKFTFDDGTIWQSYLQNCIWDSGPNVFMAMKDYETGEIISKTLWTKVDSVYKQFFPESEPEEGCDPNE